MSLALAVLIAVLAWRYWPVPGLSELRARVAKGDWSGASTGLARYVRRHPDDDQAWLLLASVQRQLGDVQAALDCLHRVPHRSPRKSQALYEEAELYWAQKKASRAERCWNEVLELEIADGASLQPGSFSQWALLAGGRLADLHLLEDRTDDARNVLWLLFNSFKKEEAGAVDLLLQLTSLDVQTQDPQLGVDTLKPLADSDPNDLEARRLLALNYLHLGRNAESFELIDEMIRANPDVPRVWDTWMRYLRAVGDRTQFRAALGSVPAGVGQRADLWKYRGMDHENHGEFDRAVECYQEAVALAPRDREARARLSQALRLAGRTSEFEVQGQRVSDIARDLSALSHYILTLPQHPGNRLRSTQCLDLARLCEALEWESEAMAWHELALARQPDLAESKEALERLRRSRMVRRPSKTGSP